MSLLAPLVITPFFRACWVRKEKSGILKDLIQPLLLLPANTAGIQDGIVMGVVDSTHDGIVGGVADSMHDGIVGGVVNKPRVWTEGGVTNSPHGWRVVGVADGTRGLTDMCGCAAKGARDCTMPCAVAWAPFEGSEGGVLPRFTKGWIGDKEGLSLLLNEGMSDE